MTTVWVTQHRLPRRRRGHPGGGQDLFGALEASRRGGSGSIGTPSSLRWSTQARWSCACRGSRVADAVMPFFDGKLAGGDGGADAVHRRSGPPGGARWSEWGGPASRDDASVVPAHQFEKWDDRSRVNMGGESIIFFDFNRLKNTRQCFRLRTIWLSAVLDPVNPVCIIRGLVRGESDLPIAL